MTNLLAETTDDIARSGHTIDDVVFIGSADGEYQCTWDDYRVIADTEYDSGYGAPEVAQDLVIRFSDGTYMYRFEYDGAENWQWTSRARVVIAPQPIRRLTAGAWSSIAKMQAEVSA